MTTTCITIGNNSKSTEIDQYRFVIKVAKLINKNFKKIGLSDYVSGSQAFIYCDYKDKGKVLEFLFDNDIYAN